ncbi:MAG: hypothetical protein K2P30_15910, partial [Lachnospiraceae bacterium]|nr:hypothetical protein [Lachnospiraceae bacterium]
MSQKIVKHKKILAVILVIAMTVSVFTGCGTKMIESTENKEQTNQTTDGTDKKQEGGEQGKDTPDSADSNAMGRYVETSTDMSEYCSESKEIVRLADGTIVVCDR